MGHDVAVPRGVDPTVLASSLNRAHDTFLSTGDPGPGVRPVVVESWRRSLGRGLDPERSLAEIRLDATALSDARSRHPLRVVMPVIRRLLVEAATDAGLLVAVSDSAGQLLWVEGASELRRRAEQMHFLPGADWSETSAGTNAPGTALALGVPVQIFGPEHLSRPATAWSCSAAPLHDPDTGRLLGVLDLTGGPEVASPQTLSLVRATVAAAEAELRLHRLVDRPRAIATTGLDQRVGLEVLGAHGALLRGPCGRVRLSPRHSEILLLLATAEDGLTAGELAVALSEQDLPEVTVRAEVSRLRAVLPGLAVASRPYRWLRRPTLDAERVRRLVGCGDLARAVAEYRAPVLPASEAPGVVRVRRVLHEQLRSALLAGADVEALLAFADTAHGQHDLPLWQTVLDRLPAGSVRRPAVAAQVAALDAELG